MLLLVSNNAFAIGDGGKHSFEIGMDTYYFDYKESLTLPSKSTESGWLPGVYVDYTMNERNSLYLKGSFKYAKGDLTYDGSSQTGTPVAFNVGNTQELYSLKGVIGSNKAMENGATVIPYVGVCYNNWNRGVAGVHSGITSYRETYQWYSALVGIRFEREIRDKWLIAFTTESKLNFGGTMKAYNSEAGIGNDMTFSLGNKGGYALEICLRYDINEQTYLSFAPWYETYSFGASESQLNTQDNKYYYEPSSTTNQYGIRCGVGYHF
ncbi:MAG: hypothetical protein WCJ49_02495 [Deltaproteobacteria bacterium]